MPCVMSKDRLEAPCEVVRPSSLSLLSQTSEDSILHVMWKAVCEPGTVKGETLEGPLGKE